MNEQLALFQLTEQYKEEREKIIKWFTRRHAVRNKVWEFNEEDIKTRLLRNLLFINKKIIEK